MIKMPQANSHELAGQKWKQVLEVDPRYDLELPPEMRKQYETAAVDYIASALESRAKPGEISARLRDLRENVKSSKITWVVNVPGKKDLKDVKNAGTRAWESGVNFYEVGAKRQEDGSYRVEISGTFGAYREFFLSYKEIKLGKTATDLAAKETAVERKAAEVEEEKERIKAGSEELEQQEEESGNKAKEIAKLMGLAQAGDQIYEDAQYRNALGKLETSPNTKKIASRGEYLQVAFETMAGKPWYAALAESQEKAEEISSKVLIISSALAELSAADEKILRMKTGAKRDEDFYRADKYNSVFSDAVKIRDAPKASLRKFWNYDARAFAEASRQVSEEDANWINAARRKGKNNFVHDVPAEVARNFLEAYEKALEPGMIKKFYDLIDRKLDAIGNEKRSKKLYEDAEEKEKRAQEKERDFAHREQIVSDMEQKAFADDRSAEKRKGDIKKREEELGKREAYLKEREGRLETSMKINKKWYEELKNYIKERVAEERNYLGSLLKTSDELGIRIKPESGERLDSYFGKLLDAVKGMKPRKKMRLNPGSYDFTVGEDGSNKLERKKPTESAKPAEAPKPVVEKPIVRI